MVQTATSGIGHNNSPVLNAEPLLSSTPSSIPVLTVTVRTASQITGLSRSTLLRRADEGAVRTILCGHRRLFDFASLKKLVGVTDAP